MVIWKGELSKVSKTWGLVSGIGTVRQSGRAPGIRYTGQGRKELANPGINPSETKTTRSTWLTPRLRDLSQPASPKGSTRLSRDYPPTQLQRAVNYYLCCPIKSGVSFHFFVDFFSTFTLPHLRFFFTTCPAVINQWFLILESYH